MSAETKKTAHEVNETFKRIVREADDAGRKAGGFDKDLATKINRVKEGASEVSKHIEKRIDQ